MSEHIVFRYSTGSYERYTPFDFYGAPDTPFAEIVRRAEEQAIAEWTRDELPRWLEYRAKQEKKYGKGSCSMVDDFEQYGPKYDDIDRRVAEIIGEQLPRVEIVEVCRGAWDHIHKPFESPPAAPPEKTEP